MRCSCRCALSSGIRERRKFPVRHQRRPFLAQQQCRPIGRKYHRVFPIQIPAIKGKGRVTVLEFSNTRGVLSLDYGAFKSHLCSPFTGSYHY